MSTVEHAWTGRSCHVKRREMGRVPGSRSFRIRGKQIILLCVLFCWMEIWHHFLSRMQSTERKPVAGQFREIVAPSQQVKQVSVLSTLPGIVSSQRSEWQDNTYLAFVRIAKTGSTSFINALNQGFTNTHPFQRFSTSLTYRMNSCFFGYLESPVHFPEIRQCTHYRYSSLVRGFEKSAPELPSQGNQTATLVVATLVRDPFERLVSIFHYTRYIHPKWSEYATKAQLECILANDIECWMTLLHEEGGSLVFDTPYQYMHFSSNVDKAISLISTSQKSDEQPKVLALINDCFDTSVRLIVKKFPYIFESKSLEGRGLEEAERFLGRSDLSHTNTRKSRTDTRNGGANNTEELLQALEEKAKVWFADDYKFYNAAVLQFQKHLRSSNIEKWDVDACNEKIKKHRSI